MPVSFLIAFVNLLSVLCYLHSGLLVADQPQQPNSSSASAKNPIQNLIDEGKRLRNKGNLTAALTKFSEAQQLARRRNDFDYEARSLILIGSAEALQFRYRAALTSLEQAIEMRPEDGFIRGIAGANKAELYQRLGDFSAAEAESEQAIQSLRSLNTVSQFSRDGLSTALMIHATVSFQLHGDSRAYQDYKEAISIAQANNNVPLQAVLWSELGVALRRAHKIDRAEQAFQKSLSLCSQKDEIGQAAIEKENLAQLELEKDSPDDKKALRLIDEAFASPSSAFKASPQYYPINIRARILLQGGNKTLALSEFMRAVTAANQWRLGALPGDITSTQTTTQLQEVYADYANLAAELALERKDNALAINALEVLAENRAASLREQLRLVYGNSGKLSDEYFAKLAELQAVQAKVTLGQNTSRDQAKLIQIRLDISDLENKIGIKSEKLPILGERIPRRNSLRDIQHTLGRDQVLISITLGKHRSYLWAVTAEAVNLSGLPGEGELTSKADSFATAVRLGYDPSVFAESLTRALFANLPADVWNRSEWMVVADGPLLNGVPFCALRDWTPGHAGKTLVESKTLRFLPSELLLTERHPEPASRKFVGVGDPIYNQADSRMTPQQVADGKTVSEGVMLARLVASGNEVRNAAKETRSVDPIILTGAKATRQNLTAALGHNPSLIHFAVHVVSPPGQPQQAALALSLRNGIPELLTSEAIAAFHVPGSLVVLSGCSSGLGKVLPGAGLVGLSRSWLLAGAAAVVVSSWPTPDDSGEFFSSFYDHFDQIKSGDTAQRAALALRQTQLEMLHGSGYKRSPSFWGAFAVIAKE